MTYYYTYPREGKAMVNLSDVPKIVIAVFALALAAMELASGIGREAFKVAWHYFLNMNSATQTLLVYLAVWTPFTLVAVFYWGW